MKTSNQMRPKLSSTELYYRLPEFTVIQSGKYLAGGLQSGHTVNLISVQYKKLTYYIKKEISAHQRQTIRYQHEFYYYTYASGEEIRYHI